MSDWPIPDAKGLLRYADGKLAIYGAVELGKYPPKHANRLANDRKQRPCTDHSSNLTVAEAVFLILRHVRGRWAGFGEHPLRLSR